MSAKIKREEVSRLEEVLQRRKQKVSEAERKLSAAKKRAAA